ncbi:hypothetical protein [Burkholderia savannae]|nr:hypothetical protein [Burkholderia savannae]
MVRKHLAKIMRRWMALAGRNPVEFFAELLCVHCLNMSSFAHLLDSADTHALPRPAVDLLHKINSDSDADRIELIMQFVASSVHPDYVFNISMLSVLPAEYKAAVTAYFVMFVSGELTLPQQATILRMVGLYFADSARSRTSH